MIGSVPRALSEIQLRGVLLSACESEQCEELMREYAARKPNTRTQPSEHILRGNSGVTLWAACSGSEQSPFNSGMKSLLTASSADHAATEPAVVSSAHQAERSWADGARVGS